MRKWIMVILGGATLVGVGWLLLAKQSSGLVTGQLNAIAAASGTEDPRWRRVTEPRPFRFPRDHGPHPEYQTEWWYYTGNLRAEDGAEFGFQLTFFRRGLDPEPTQRASRWATRNIYLAHFTISDLASDKFYAAERYSRDGADLAGGESEPYRVWLGDWQATGSEPEGMSMQLAADGGDMAIDLRLESSKPPTLQGDRGYSRKGEGAGNASYYYSLTRMTSTGTLRVGQRSYRIVEGLSWMDHEWGTTRLDRGSVGWDWFALILDDGREVTWAQLRGEDQINTLSSFGTLTAADGTTSRLSPTTVSLQIRDRWRSPRSGATYPAGWRLQIPEADLDLLITPRLADQELPVSIVYWEGAVRVEGNATGVGYVEMTGYVPAPGATLGR